MLLEERWFDPIVEIATDKVDSDITSEYQGILLEKKFDKDDVIKVGDVIAVIESSEFQEENIQEKDDIVELDLSKNKDFNFETKDDQLWLIKTHTPIHLI